VATRGGILQRRRGRRQYEELQHWCPLDLPACLGPQFEFLGNDCRVGLGREPLPRLSRDGSQCGRKTCRRDRHSRGGKTALWAGAEDERFAYVISNDSGSTGAAIARNKEGEHIRDINRGFPHWFCDNYKQFNDREDALPIDQHELLALIAPRLLYVASRRRRPMVRPRNEFLATVHASPVYELLGRRGVGPKEIPKNDSPVQTGDIATMCAAANTTSRSTTGNAT